MSYIEGFPNGFGLASNIPIDKRMKVVDITSAPADFLATAYVGLIVYDEATQKHYKVTASDGTQGGLSYSEMGLEDVGIFVYEGWYGSLQEKTLSWDNTAKVHSLRLTETTQVVINTRSNENASLTATKVGGLYYLDGIPPGRYRQRLKVQGRVKIEVPDGGLDGLNVTVRVTSLLQKKADGTWEAIDDFEETEEVFLDGIISDEGRWIKFDLSAIGEDMAEGYRFDVILETDGPAKISGYPQFVFRVEGI